MLKLSVTNKFMYTSILTTLLRDSTLTDPFSKIEVLVLTLLTSQLQ